VLGRNFCTSERTSGLFTGKPRDSRTYIIERTRAKKIAKIAQLTFFVFSLALYFLPLYPSFLLLAANAAKFSTHFASLNLCVYKYIYYNIYIYKNKISQNSHPWTARRGAKWVENFAAFAASQTKKLVKKTYN
jgi:hypothetical protein